MKPFVRTCGRPRTADVLVAHGQNYFVGARFEVTDELIKRAERMEALAKARAKEAKRRDQELSACIDNAWEEFIKNQPELRFDVWTDEAIAKLLRVLFDDAMDSLKGLAIAEIRYSLEWMFASDMRVLKSGKNDVYKCPVEIVPFSFRFCCNFFGFDYEELQKGSVVGAIYFHENEIQKAESASLTGKTDVSQKFVQRHLNAIAEIMKFQDRIVH